MGSLFLFFLGEPPAECPLGPGSAAGASTIAAPRDMAAALGPPCCLLPPWPPAQPLPQAPLPSPDVPSWHREASGTLLQPHPSGCPGPRAVSGVCFEHLTHRQPCVGSTGLPSAHFPVTGADETCEERPGNLWKAGFLQDSYYPDLPGREVASPLPLLR